MTRTRRYKKRGSKKRIARGIYSRTPRRVPRNEYLVDRDIENIILDRGGDTIQLSYWSKTGHELENDLKNIQFEKDKTYMGSTLHSQVVWKLDNWIQGNYGNEYIT